MNLGLDAYADLESPLHHWDPRFKLLGLVSLIFAFSLVRDLRLLPAMLVVSAIVYGASNLPLAFLLSRLRYPGAFLLIMAVLLPFMSGSTVVLEAGPLALRLEGSLELLRIVVKFMSIVTVGLVLFGTSPFLTSIKAMRALSMPAILADMMLLSYRYIFEIGGDLGRMETAMRLRGFRVNRVSARGFGILASLAGTILVRSHERSDRVYKAMMLRGYGQTQRQELDEFQAVRADVIALAGVLLVAAGFVVAEVFLRRLGG